MNYDGFPIFEAEQILKGKIFLDYSLSIVVNYTHKT